MEGEHPARGSAAYAYRRAPDQDRSNPPRHPVVIVGAGPVGLVLALDLARKGRQTVVLDRRTSLSHGSRAICWSKRTLEIMGRLGIADRLVQRGVTWSRGKVFHRSAEVFAFDLLPDTGHQRPAFINLQQFLFEEAVIEACAETGLVDIRWGHEVSALTERADCTELEVATPEGTYRIAAGWLVACDGARSTIRQALALGFVGQTFDDQFLICDIRMQVERPTERWFWFDPPFNPGQSALMHRQADNVWRLDFQIGPDADREVETRPENVARRVRGMLGDVDFAFEWISCYRFHCRRLERFRHGRVLFAGDAAHQVSPFGARGGNSGVQDADNLAWKLDLVLGGLAPERLLDSYDSERRKAADENICHSTRATDFISPKGPGAAVLRDAVLGLAGREPAARQFLNSGRLSTPTVYDGSPLSTVDGFAPGDSTNVRPGAAAVDAPGRGGWLLAGLGGRFSVLDVRRTGESDLIPTSVGIEPDGLRVPVDRLVVTSDAALERYGATERPALYLIRPDQHVAARWRRIDGNALTAAVRRAIAEA